MSLNSKIKKFCLVCNKIFYVSPSAIKHRNVKYCSNKCYYNGRIYKTNTVEDFWKYVDIKSENECWEWKKYKNPSGYGQIHYERKLILSHRLAYFLSHPEQDIEENRKLFVLHTCDNPPCCNPNHLFLGTPKDNMNDKVNKNRQLKGEDIKSAKLTEEQVKQILLLKNILKIKIIAEMYDINRRTLLDIFHNKTWKHVNRNI